jgi:cytochrome c-L
MSISNKARLAMSVMAMVVGMVFGGVAQAEDVECKFISTNDNSPLAIKVYPDDTPEAKEFYKTCKNPYTKKYAADAEAAKAGKKKFGYYSCTQCHGGNAGGQTGPSIIDDRWQYAKHTTDKGIFESIAGGTPAGMPAWHKDVAGNPELLPTDDILKIIGWLRASYTGGGDKPWLKD